MLVPLQSAQTWVDAFMHRGTLDAKNRGQPEKLLDIDRQEMVIAAVENVVHDLAFQSVQNAKQDPSLARLVGIFNADTTTRDLKMAGLWGMQVQVLREQEDKSLPTNSGDIGKIMTHYPVGLNVFDLSMEAPVAGLDSTTNAVVGVRWRDLIYLDDNGQEVKE